MRSAKDSSKNPLRYLAILLVAVFLVSAVLVAVNLWESGQGLFPGQGMDGQPSVIEYNGQDYVLREDVETVLVMGLDKFEMPENADSYNNDLQADFLILLVIDEKNESCSAIHINRDTMTSVNVLGVAGQKIDTQTMQIALSHTFGNGKEVSCNNTADAVSRLLYGVKIDHYVSLTMDAVALINDMVGGVEVTVLEDFSGIDDTLIQGEKVTLQGDQALTYVRTRYGVGDSSNATRMNRQRQYLQALFDQVRAKSEADESFSLNSSMELAEYMVTSGSVNQMQSLMDKIVAYGDVIIRSIEGESVVGDEFMEFYPDEQSLKKEVVELFTKPKDE